MNLSQKEVDFYLYRFKKKASRRKSYFLFIRPKYVILRDFSGITTGFYNGVSIAY